MTRILTYLGRFVMILVGYTVASLAASAFLNIVFLASAGFDADETPQCLTGSLIFSIPFVALFVAYFAFIPSARAILVAEIFGKRDWLYYAVAGGIVAVVVLGFFWHAANEMYQVSGALDLPSSRRTHIRRSPTRVSLCWPSARACSAASPIGWSPAVSPAGGARDEADAISPGP